MNENNETKDDVAQSLLMDFDQEWKINDNIKRMRQSFNRRLNNS